MVIVHIMDKHVNILLFGHNSFSFTRLVIYLLDLGGGGRDPDITE